MRKKKFPKKKSQRLNPRVLISFFLLFLIVTVLGGISVLLTPICANSISCIKDLSGTYDPNAKSAEYLGRTIPVISNIAEIESQPVVLSDSSPSNKHIYVDLTTQTIYAKEGDATIFSFPVSSGKWGKTPTGDFLIWIKLRYTRMKGGSKTLGTYYNLPNVPYTMYFYNAAIPKSRGYGIHGAYWHNNFGHPMSHGCINMREADVEKIYNWADPSSTENTTYASDDHPGTPITIYGVAPAQ